MDHFSTFDVDFAAQHDEQKAARHASILFHHRASERFEGFLRQAAHKDEFEARAALIESDLRATAAEVDGDAGALTAAFIGHIAGGAFCDDCRKWKTGPKSLCSCGSEEPNGDGALSDDVSAVGGKESKVAFRVTASPYINQDTGNELPTGGESGLHEVAQPGDKPCGHCGQGVNVVSNVTQCPHCGKSTGGPGLESFGDQLGQAFGLGGGNPNLEKGDQEPHPLADQGYSWGGDSHYNSNVTASDSTGLDDKGSLPFKKEKHAPEVPEKSGDKQDVKDTADYEKDPDLGKMEDVGKKNEVKGDHTKTWTGTKDQADPVTSHFLSDEEVTRVLADA